MDLWQALSRWWRHYYDGKSSTELWQWRREKAEEETAKNNDDAGLITWLRSKEKPRRSLSHASAKPRAATGATGTEQKVADNVA